MSRNLDGWKGSAVGAPTQYEVDGDRILVDVPHAALGVAKDHVIKWVRVQQGRILIEYGPNDGQSV